jgi:hypothetical protein
MTGALAQAAAPPPVPLWARPALLLRRIHPTLAASVRPDLALLARIHPRLPMALPLVVVAIVVVFSVARVTVNQVYTESLIFLVLAVAVGMVAPAAGVLLVLLHGGADLARALLDPYASAGQYGPIGTIAGRLISFYLLWLLVVEIPVVARMVPAVVMDSDRPANPNARKLVAIGSTGVAVGLMTWIWTQAAGLLIRPVFTWSGLSSPTYDAIANLQVNGMLIVLVAAGFAAAMGILRLQRPSGEALGDPSFTDFEDFDLDQFEAEPSEGLGLIGQLGRHLLAIFLLGGLMTGFLDLAIIGGVALLSQPVASRVLRNDRLRKLLGGIPWVIRFVTGFGLTYVIGYVINTVRYEPLAGSEFFPLVLTVAFGLLIFQVLLSDVGTDEDREEAEPGEAAEAAGAPSAGGAIGAALAIFAVGAMLQLAFPATAFADNCSGLFDCNQTIGAAAAAAAGAAAAAAGAAASRNQSRRKAKRRRKKKPAEEEPSAEAAQPGASGDVPAPDSDDDPNLDLD